MRFFSLSKVKTGYGRLDTALLNSNINNNIRVVKNLEQYVIVVCFHYILMLLIYHVCVKFLFSLVYMLNWLILVCSSDQRTKVF